MDASASTGNSKRQKVYEGQDNDKSEDRISDLPTNILHYILSFLPTKYAVGTSVLSTKWKYLWTSIHNLNFCDQMLYSTSSKNPNCSKRKRFFNHFVDRVLHLNDVSNIHRFSLTCEECDATYFNKWISSIITRKVQEMIISIRKKPPYMFPRSLLTCKSLRVLKIGMEVSLDIPASICFSHLTVLHLEYITFFSTQSIQEVSLSFPILEEFEINHCTWLEIKTVNISVPTLRMLAINDWHHNELQDCEIKINAERLISLKMSSGLPYKYSLCHLSSLKGAFLEIFSSRDIVHRVGSLLKGIFNVRDLELSASSIYTLSLPACLVHMQSLSRLVHLKVTRGFYSVGTALIDLLTNMPYLESLFFPLGLDQDQFIGNGRIRTTPVSFLSNLELVDVTNFRGTPNDLWFVNFLMKNVKVKDKLTIKLRSSSKETLAVWQESITRRLIMLPKDSNCLLEFIG